MHNSPYDPPTEVDTPGGLRRNRQAFRLFLGVWLIGSCIALVFSLHLQNPFQGFTSLIPFAAIPIPIAIYASVIATVWRVVPAFKYQILNEFIFTGSVLLGGIFAPHVLTFVAERLSIA